MDALTWTHGSSPRRVMIVDDEDLVRASLADMVELSGYQVCGQAANGYEAARLIGGAHPDIVLMDIMMPTMDGVERRCRSSTPPGPPALSSSAPTAPGLFEQVTRAGAQGYLMKPFRPERLGAPPSRPRSRSSSARALQPRVDRIESFFERAWSQASRREFDWPRAGRGARRSVRPDRGDRLRVVVRQGARMRALSVRGVKGHLPGRPSAPPIGRLGVALQRQGSAAVISSGRLATRLRSSRLQVALDDGVLGCLCLLAPEGYSFTPGECAPTCRVVRGLSTFSFGFAKVGPMPGTCGSTDASAYACGA